MRLYYSVIAFLILFTSCNKTEKIVFSDIAEAIPSGQIEVKGTYKNFRTEVTDGKMYLAEINLSGRNETGQLLEELSDSIDSFRNTREKSCLDDCQSLWERISTGVSKMDTLQTLKWIESNAELLKITGGEKYAEILEIILYGLSEDSLQIQWLNKIKDRIHPVIFTKNIDNIYVNIFAPSGIEFEHSFRGKVKIEQGRDENDNRKINLKFHLAEKQYMELYIRIPAWAKEPHVEVKKVKYLDMPGSYCKIAKKWRNGDIVEIIL